MFRGLVCTLGNITKMIAGAMNVFVKENRIAQIDAARCCHLPKRSSGSMTGDAWVQKKTSGPRRTFVRS